MKTFEEFYPFYLQEHSTRGCRVLHYIGTTGVIALAVSAVVSGDARLVLGLPLVGYSFAWIGHFGVEKNRPATFKHPLWSLRADFFMYFEWLSGRLGKSLDAAGVIASGVVAEGARRR